jgi:hypothetical protein
MPDDDPKIVARLLVYLYTKSYPILGRSKWLDLDNEHYYAYRKKLAFLMGCNDSNDDIPKTSLSVEVAVHGLAEKYMIPKLKQLSREAYQMIVQRQAWCPQATQQFITSISTIYKTTRPSDPLREFVVWMTQREHWMRPSFSAFQELISSEGSFAWDLASKGMARPWVWCRDCGAALDLPREICQCGMMGYCVQSVVCGKWKMLACPVCGMIGQCQSEEPAVFRQAAQAPVVVVIED